MKYLFSLLFLTCFVACSTSKKFFAAKTLHEQYGQKLTDAGLNETALGRQWFAAAAKALAAPQLIELPHKEVGYFPSDQPRATGIKFAVRRGEKLNFTISKNPSSQFSIYIDLWKVNDGQIPSLLKSLDSATNNFTLEVEKDEQYILRLQPELLKSGDYTLSIATGPSLAFPVPGGKIGSFWGDARDAGVRKHEGVDIFAAKRQPAVAGAAGLITSVREGGIGGKVVFLRPTGKDYTLYYAHLDEQLVQQGQTVAAGETIGLVGNTGNAATTSPHLHFGIYAVGGAINPINFINPRILLPEDFKPNQKDFLSLYRTKDAVQITEARFPANSVARVLATSAKHYRVEMANGEILTVPLKMVQPVGATLATKKIKVDAYLMANPSVDAARIVQLPAATNVQIIGYSQEFSLVKIKDIQGWLPASVF